MKTIPLNVIKYLTFMVLNKRKLEKQTSPSPDTKKWHLSLIAFKGSTSQYSAFEISATIMRLFSFFIDKCTLVSREILGHNWSKSVSFSGPIG